MGELENACACGASIGDCAFWQAVRAEVEAGGIGWDEAVRASVGQAHVGRFWRTWRAAPSDPELTRLAEITRAVTGAIAKVAGKPHVLNSTKEPTRGLFLAKFVPEAQLIRLVRDPRSAVASHYWRLKEKGFYHFLRRDWHTTRLGPAVPGRGRDELDRRQSAGRNRCTAGLRPRPVAALRGSARRSRCGAARHRDALRPRPRG